MNFSSPVRVYVDGENFTISLFNAIKASGESALHLNVNWHNLARTYMREQKGEVLDKVFYFTAHYKQNPRRLIAQRAYKKQLEAHGVGVVLGQFKRKDKQCPKCHSFFFTHEEKETDINIALRVVCDAEDGLYNRAIIVSADTDLVSAVREVKRRHPSKNITIVTPPKDPAIKRSAHEFLKVADDVQEMPLKRIKPYLFRK